MAQIQALLEMSRKETFYQGETNNETIAGVHEVLLCWFGKSMTRPAAKK
jgi:hypothetical protein